MNPNSALSFIARSCLFTKGCAARKNKVQKVRKSYSIPEHDVRKHLAEMIAEEAMETIIALGFQIGSTDNGKLRLVSRRSTHGEKPDLEKIIDGACDTIYVSTGALVACGVPDLPHLEEVCRANDRKFPDGQVVIDPQSGKYLKPIGWTPPDHEHVKKEYKPITDMTELTKQLLYQGSSHDPADERGLRPVPRRSDSPGGHGSNGHSSGHEVLESDDQKDQKKD